MPETETPQQQPTTEATPMDAGVSTETYNASKKEAEELRATIASLKARVEVSDSQKREQILGMKDEINDFVNKEVINCSYNEPYKQQLMPVSRYLAAIDQGEQLDTNLSIGRLVSCFSGTLKREREEFSKTKDASNLLADANKRLEEITADRDGKLQRLTELEGLVEERTKAAQAFQDELAKAGHISEKIDFSNKSSRENAGSSSGAKTTEPASLSVTSTTINASMGSIDPNRALFDFMQGGPKNGGLKIGQSGTGHHFLGATGSSDGGAIAAAMRGY